jgi:hypothetical protein
MMDVPPKLLRDLLVVLDLGLLDLAEEGIDVLLYDAALLLDVQQVVDGVY